MLKKLKNPDFKYRYTHLCIISVFFIAFILICGFSNPGFRTPYNIKNLFQSSFPLMMGAFAQTLIILTGGIDLSVGGIISLCNVTAVSIMTKMPGMQGAIVAVIASIIVGLLCGAINGAFVTYGRISPIIVTIATNVIFQGLALFVLPIPGGKVDMNFIQSVNGSIGNVVPYALFYLVIIIYVMRRVTNKTSFGIGLRSVGGNEGSAYSTGVKVNSIKLKAYILAGLFCALAGIFLSCIMYSGDPNIGKPFTMNSITATVVGGTLMTGAVGDVLGTSIGVFIIYIINNMLNLMGVSSYYQYVFQGSFLIIALIISNIRIKEKISN